MIAQRPLSWILTAACLQLVFVLCFPVFGDEAYFIAWGQQFQLGIYDHPPMPGWIAYVLNQVLWGEHAYRLFSWGMGLCLALVMHRLLEPMLGRSKATAATLAWLWLPGNLLIFSMYLNDTVAYISISLFSACIYMAWKQQRFLGQLGFALLAGAFMGAAMLTKYLSGAYAMAYLALVLIMGWKSPRLFWQITVVGLVSLYLFSINLQWNYEHCQINFTFSFFHRENGIWWVGLAQLFGSLLVLLSPVFFWKFLKGIFKNNSDEPKFFTLLFAVSLLVFVASSASSGAFGAHWGAPLIWLGYLALSECNLEEKSYQGLAYSNVAFGGVLFGMLTLFAVGVQTMDAEDFIKSEKQQRYVKFLKDLRNGSVEHSLKTQGDVLLASELYSTVSSFTNHGMNAALMFNTSQFGRNDDIRVDYRHLNGKTIVYLEPLQKAKLDTMRSVFESFEAVEVTGKHASYTAYVGKGFNFDAYKRGFIDPVIAKYYSFVVPAKACHMDKYIREAQ